MEGELQFHSCLMLTAQVLVPCWIQFCLQFSRSVVSDSSWLHGLQHAGLPCPSPTPRVHQIHVYGVCDAIQPSHPLSSPSPPAFNLTQHQGLFKWVSSSNQVENMIQWCLGSSSFFFLFLFIDDSSPGLHSEWLMQPSCTRSCTSRPHSAFSNKEHSLAISCIVNLFVSSVLSSSSCLSLCLL